MRAIPVMGIALFLKMLRKREINIDYFSISVTMTLYIRICTHSAHKACKFIALGLSAIFILTLPE